MEKTNFAKKTFANRPKEILRKRKLSRIGKAAIVDVAIYIKACVWTRWKPTYWKLSCEATVPIRSSENSPYLLVCSSKSR